MVKTKELNSFNLIKNQLNRIFNKIHIVYFFIKAQSNLEQCIDILQYIKDINLKRHKNNINKIPIIFIKNGEDLKITQEKPIIFQELKKELTKHNLIELYDSSVNKNNEVKNYNVDNFFEEDDNNNDKKYDNYIEGNIIQVHIPTGKNMDKIFSTTKEYLIRNNFSLVNEDFSSLKSDSQQLINFYIKEKLESQSLTYEEKQKLSELYKKCNSITNIYKNSCSVLYNLDILSVKSKALKFIGIIGLIVTAPFFIIIIPALILGPLFSILLDEAMINNIAIKFGFGQKDLYDYGLSKYIYKKENKELSNEKLQKKCQNLFEDLIYYMGPIQCLIKSNELLEQIINLFEELKNKKEDDWNTFKIEKF